MLRKLNPCQNEVVDYAMASICVEHNKYMELHSIGGRSVIEINAHLQLSSKDPRLALRMQNAYTEVKGDEVRAAKSKKVGTNLPPQYSVYNCQGSNILAVTFFVSGIKSKTYNLMTKVIGINRTQDASISIFDNGNHIFSIQKERITKKKHDWGKLGDIGLYKDITSELNRCADVIVQSFSSDVEIGNIPDYKEELYNLGLANENTKLVYISHHLSHLFTLYPETRFDDYAVMIIDAIGSNVKNVLERFPGRENREDEFEIASYYSCQHGKYECVNKQTIVSLEQQRGVGLGNFYGQLKGVLFPGEGNEGKVMGLAAYGNKDRFRTLPKLIVQHGEVTIPREILDLFDDPKYEFGNPAVCFQEKADLAAFGQSLFENALLEITEWLLKVTGKQKLAYAGGCALNCVANEKIKRYLKDKTLYIPPAPHDGGTSVGAAIYGHYLYRLPIDFSWSSDYLGPRREIDCEVLRKEAAMHGFTLHEPDDIYEEALSLIEGGFVLGLFGPQSEFGPRALGNRSIICDARYLALKFYINAFIKGREWFRPIAPIVLLEDAYQIFELDFESKFMLYSVKIKRDFENRFAAIGHPNSYVRVQTITNGDNDFIYNLLHRYRAEHGVGIICNTSFNGMNETIVESISDAFDCFATYPIHYLVVPPYIISKSLKPDSPLNLKSLVHDYNHFATY